MSSEVRAEIGTLLARGINVVEDKCLFDLIEAFYRVKTQRDQARRIAVRLEQELAVVYNERDTLIAKVDDLAHGGAW